MLNKSITYYDTTSDELTMECCIGGNQKGCVLMCMGEEYREFANPDLLRDMAEAIFSAADWLEAENEKA